MFLGSDLMKHSSYCAYSIRQSLPRITVDHLKQANYMLKALRGIRTILKCRRLQDTVQVGILTLPDAAFNMSGRSTVIVYSL